MVEMMENDILIRDVETKNIMTKSNLPVGGYSVNPYVGCTHGCKYCYASFMKRFTGHTEPWGTFLDVKHWREIKNSQKYRGQRVVIGSVTDGYLPQEEQFQNTRKLLEQLKGSGAEILICTKSDLVVGGKDIAGKECALIACCEEEDLSVLDGVRIPMERTAALNKWKMVGEVLIPGVLNAGDINKTDGCRQAAELVDKI